MAPLITTALTDLVLAEQRGGVLVLTFNRPDRLNAWNDELEEQYFDLLALADASPEVRAVVVTGAGRGFCAGADLADLANVGELEDGTLPPSPRPRTYPLTLRKPLIAAVNGAAAGLGLVEALYCDVRFATPEAKLLTAFAQRGLIAEYGMAWLLPRLVGQSRALDLLLSSRVVKGEEALRMGLVDYVIDQKTLLEEAIAYADRLATQSSPWSMSMIKQQVHEAMDSSLATSVDLADGLMTASFRGPDVLEGVASYAERRTPRFAGLGPA